MNVSHEPVPQTDGAVARVLRGARANDTAALPKQHTKRTPQCVPVGRLFAVARSGGVWTPDEQKHLGACAFCRDSFAALSGFPYQPVSDDETTVLGLGLGDETTHVDLGSRRKPGDTTT